MDRPSTETGSKLVVCRLVLSYVEAIRDSITKTLQKTSKPGQKFQYISAPLAGGCARLICVIVMTPVQVATAARFQAEFPQKFTKLLMKKVFSDPKIYLAGVGQTIRDGFKKGECAYWGTLKYSVQGGGGGSDHFC